MISITDGQIFLEGDLFFSGVRPAVNVGISVSRVGGNAQIGAMRKNSGTLRLDLAQYRSLAAFAQFGSDLDRVTLQQLARGERLVELLKQGQYAPLSIADQVLSILAGTRGALDDLKVEAVRPFEDFMHRHFQNEEPELRDRIRAEGKLSDELDAQIMEAIGRAFQLFVAENPDAALEEN